MWKASQGGVGIPEYVCVGSVHLVGWGFPGAGSWSMPEEFDGVHITGFMEGNRHRRLDWKDPRGYLSPGG